MTPEQSNDDDAAALLRWARAEFSEFYALASARDIALLDDLTHARVRFAAGISVPRAGLAPDARRILERDTDAREREFIRARDAVVGCETFKAMDAAERARLARYLLDAPETIA